MARGNPKLSIVQFVVNHDAYEYNRSPKIDLSILSVTDGKADFSAYARFTGYAHDTGDFEVRNIDSRRPDRNEAIMAAKLMLPTALEAEPMPIDREIAQLSINTYTRYGSD